MFQLSGVYCRFQVERFRSFIVGGSGLGPQKAVEGLGV